ncbi:MAG: hypothetical protein ACXADW_06030, partial [Candidatus Hodarchaeales archaeon]
VQILEKEVTSLSGSVDLVKEHEKLLLNQNFSKALIVGYTTILHKSSRITERFSFEKIEIRR